MNNTDEYENITLDDLLEGEEQDTLDVWMRLQESAIQKWSETEELFQIEKISKE